MYVVVDFPYANPLNMELKAKLIEIFSAIQGEGLNIGTRQIFIRLAMCDLRCRFCDSAHTWQVTPTCRIEETPGNRDFTVYDNPVDMFQLLEWIEKQNIPGLHDSISLTGGEPLLQVRFLQEFLPMVKQQTGLPIYLETGGHRPAQLQMILSDLDLVGMDVKLPSVSGESHWAAHDEFLRLCWDAGVEVFVKLIVSGETNEVDLQMTGDLVAAISPKIPVFLQPVTPLKLAETLEAKHGLGLVAPTPDQVLQWQGLMKRQLERVRVVPQTHKFMNQL